MRFLIILSSVSLFFCDIVGIMSVELFLLEISSSSEEVDEEELVVGCWRSFLAGNAFLGRAFFKICRTSWSEPDSELEEVFKDSSWVDRISWGFFWTCFSGIRVVSSSESELVEQLEDSRCVRISWGFLESCFFRTCIVSSSELGLEDELEGFRCDAQIGWMLLGIWFFRFCVVDFWTDESFFESSSES